MMQIKRKYTVLLLSLLLLLVLYPVIQWLDGGLIALNLSFTLVLLAALYTIAHSRRSLIGGLVFLVFAMVGLWAHRVTAADWAVWMGVGFAGVLIAYTALVLLLEILRSECVTMDTLAGGVAIYLLIGIVGAFVHVLIVLADPQAFYYSVTSAAAMQNGLDDFQTYVFYSFTALTTLGFGDIVPVNPLARTVSYLEAVIGQVYLAVLIARLVGQQLSGTRGG